ncbi:peroxiredoxin [Chitinispirillales bacterium ANBcel5]|uniref:peroxiredoxin n=1 Tax=Cellulosispirillum alkaliphilum TaxID=3039283 RepID=UPI002A526324|nr:peroxiredoxin [Chitinispirillales bacterium ANBcel5]
MVLVGRNAPDFEATAVRENEIIESFKLSDLKGKYIVLYFYPLDFTFVCPTELHAFNEKLSEFHSRNTELIAVSVDSHYSHFAWLSTSREKGGIEGVKYPIVSDLTKEISQAYDVLVEGKGVAYRGLFLIDKDFVVRHQLVNDLPLGRSVDEVIRMVDALQFYEERGEVCPANWRAGDRSMVPDQKGLQEYFAQTK